MVANAALVKPLLQKTLIMTTQVPVLFIYISTVLFKLCLDTVDFHSEVRKISRKLALFCVDMKSQSPNFDSAMSENWCQLGRYEVVSPKQENAAPVRNITFTGS